MTGPGAIDHYYGRNGVKCVGYGGSGVGKTRLVLTCPRPIYIGAERGGLSIRGHNVVGFEISTLAQLIEAHRWVTTSAEMKAFDTICVDSISEIGDVILRNEKGNTKDGRKAHGAANDLVVNNIYRSFRDLPGKHMYAIAKESSYEDTVTGTRSFAPAMPNTTMRNELPYFFDLVFRYVRMKLADGTIWEGLQTFNDGTAIAKDRSGTLGMWEPPHLGNVFAKIMKGTT
jgi:hypothetical protein